MEKKIEEIRRVKEIERLKQMKNGSFTVEASILIPFLLFIICAVLCLSLYLHDRSVLASCAAEAAGKGAQKKYLSEEEMEAWLTGEAQGLAAGRLLSLKEFEVEAEVTKQTITVTYTGRTELLGGLEIYETERAKRLQPVEFIRGSRQLEELLKGQEKLR